MQTTLFISHATPTDNEFAAWLAAKLQMHGYAVWVDINELDPATDFWNTIERTIRDEAVKFLFVVTQESISNKRDGVKKELAVADRVRKSNADFIIPLRIDNVSFDDFPVEIIRQNAIDFYNDWAGGLLELIAYLEKQNVPKTNEAPAQMEIALQRWKEIRISRQDAIVKQKDFYYSNLFPLELPKALFAYRENLSEIERWLKDNRCPFLKIKNIIVTLVCDNCISQHITPPVDCLSFPFIDVLNSADSIYAWETEIMKPNRMCVNLLNWNIDAFFQRKGLRKYRITDAHNVKNRYYFRQGTVSRQSAKSRLKHLAGAYKGKNWHYGISAYYTTYPFSGIVMKWHLFFSDGNGHLLPDAQQIRARRSKGRLFFNKEWLSLLKACMYYLADGSDSIEVFRCCKANSFSIYATPYIFKSLVGYLEPTAEPQTTIKEFNEYDE